MWAWGHRRPRATYICLRCYVIQRPSGSYSYHLSISKINSGAVASVIRISSCTIPNHLGNWNDRGRLKQKDHTVSNMNSTAAPIAPPSKAVIYRSARPEAHADRSRKLPPSIGGSSQLLTTVLSAGELSAARHDSTVECIERLRGSVNGSEGK